MRRAESPAARPLRALTSDALKRHIAAAFAARDGIAGAHGVHELWMRNDMASNVEPLLARLWELAADTIPEWLPMYYVEWLPLAYEVAARFEAPGRGRSNLYLVLLDYRDSREEPFGIYVGMSRYAPAQRFDQHKAGIRAAGSVLKRGLEVLTGPTLHLQNVSRTAAADIEARLAEALSAAGLFVQGGH